MRATIVSRDYSNISPKASLLGSSKASLAKVHGDIQYLQRGPRSRLHSMKFLVFEINTLEERCEAFQRLLGKRMMELLSSVRRDAFFFLSTINGKRPAISKTRAGVCVSELATVSSPSSLK